MNKINLTVFQHTRDNNAGNSIEVDWIDLVDLLSKHDPREDKDGMMFNGWKFVSKLEEGFTRRCGDNCEYTTLLILDYDGGMTIGQAKRQFIDYTYTAYTSYSHRTEKKKGADCFRIVFPLIQPCPIEDFRKRKSAIKMFAGDCDCSSSDISRGFFLPSCSQFNIGMARTWSNVGKMLNVVSMKQDPTPIFKEETLKTEMSDSRKQEIYDLLVKIHVGHEPTWWKVALAMHSNGFKMEDYVSLTVGGLMNQKTRDDAERKWEQAAKSGKKVSIGFLVNLLKDKGVWVRPVGSTIKKQANKLNEVLKNRSMNNGK